jgi:16S rRNA (guanine527-N7)-methyltransferase
VPDPLPPTPEFLAAAAELGIDFDPGDVERLGRFLAILLDANSRFNLTAITDPAEAWRRHILDALTLVPLLAELPENARVIDVGTGGGVPGLPLAIVMPALRFTLLEATGKKCVHLRQSAEALELKNVEVVNDRAERAGQDAKNHRERYDAAVIRAVGAMAIIAEYALPLVRKGGLVLAVKGAKADEEVEAARLAIGLLGGRVADIQTTPTGRIVVLEKASLTPRGYPRRDGEPAREPLGVKPK